MYIGVDKDLSEDILLHNVIFSKDFDNNINEIFSGKYPKIHQYMYTLLVWKISR